MANTASLTIEFGDVGDMYIAAEINDADNDGKTQFQAGDTVNFRVYYSGDSSSQPYEVTQTAGSCSKQETNTKQNIKDLRENGDMETVSFGFSATSSTDKYIDTFNSYTWIGTAPTDKDGATGVVKKSNHNEVSGGNEKQIGVAKIDYDTRYDLWQYSSPSELNGSTTYSVVIGIAAAV